MDPQKRGLGDALRTEVVVTLAIRLLESPEGHYGPSAGLVVDFRGRRRKCILFRQEHYEDKRHLP